MQIQVPDDIQQLSLAAGFSDVNQFVESLLRQERERLALLEGLNAKNAGHVTNFDEFDEEFRKKNQLAI